MLSRAFAANASAAAATFADVFGFVIGLEVLGFSGSGGGARSGSELSHLYFANRAISFIHQKVHAADRREEMVTKTRS